MRRKAVEAAAFPGLVQTDASVVNTVNRYAANAPRGFWKSLYWEDRRNDGLTDSIRDSPMKHGLRLTSHASTSRRRGEPRPESDHRWILYGGRFTRSARCSS